ncbi:hypothetical protein Aperf_G00000020711 [Anoplocephala perfoliata]
MKSNQVTAASLPSAVLTFRSYIDISNTCKSKSTVCLNEEAPVDSIYSSGVYASQPSELDNIYDAKHSRRRNKHGKTSTHRMKHSFSFSRLFRRTSKSCDLLDEDPEEAFDMPPHLMHEVPTSAANFDDGGSWSSLLGDQPRQTAALPPTPTQSVSKRPVENKYFFASKARQPGNTATLRPKSELIHQGPNQTDPSLTVNSVYLQKSCSNTSVDDPNASSPNDPTVTQQRRVGRRNRLFSSSQQPLNDPSGYNPPEKCEVNIKSRGIDFGRIHSSLVGGRDNCFYVKTPTGDTRVFAAASQGERNCWLTR